jgi:hypothetical protein
MVGVPDCAKFLGKTAESGGPHFCEVRTSWTAGCGRLTIYVVSREGGQARASLDFASWNQLDGLAPPR